jgi:hypothetical protein
MTTLRAHFDGRVFVPDEPVNLAVGTPLELHFEHADRPPLNATSAPYTFERDPITGLTVIREAPGALPITPDDVRRAEDEF